MRYARAGLAISFRAHTFPRRQGTPRFRTYVHFCSLHTLHVAARPPISLAYPPLGRASCLYHLHFLRQRWVHHLRRFFQLLLPATALPTPLVLHILFLYPQTRNRCWSNVLTIPLPGSLVLVQIHKLILIVTQLVPTRSLPQGLPRLLDDPLDTLRVTSSHHISATPGHVSSTIATFAFHSQI